MAVAQSKPARGPEACRCNHRLLTQLRLIVAMPAHTVSTVAVEVRKHGIENGPARRLDLSLDLLEQRRPSDGLKPKPRICVACTRMPIEMSDSSLLVQKFGGTSLSDLKGFNASADVIEKHAAERRVIVVLSAVKGVTDLLLAAIDAAVEGSPVERRVATS